MPAPAHSIRLRHPWDWNDSMDGHRVVARRRFRRPTGLGLSTRVALVLDGLPAPCHVSLNDHSLRDRFTEGRADITAEMQPGNLLQLEFTSPHSTAERDTLRAALNSGAVRLEIQESAS